MMGFGGASYSFWEDPWGETGDGGGGGGYQPIRP